MKNLIVILAMIVLTLSVSSFVPTKPEVPSTPAEIDMVEVQAMLYLMAKYGGGVVDYDSTWRPLFVINDSLEVGAWAMDKVYKCDRAAVQSYSKGERFDVQAITGQNVVVSKGDWHVPFPNEIPNE